jgi:DNA primase
MIHEPARIASPQVEKVNLQPPFDIFRLDPDGAVTWRTVVQTLEAAKRYVKDLKPTDSQEYLIVSLKTGRKAKVKLSNLDSLTESSGGS